MIGRTKSSGSSSSTESNTASEVGAPLAPGTAQGQGEAPSRQAPGGTDGTQGESPAKFRYKSSVGADVGSTYDLDDLLTVELLAEKLHVAVKTVRDWVYRRTVPFTKFGGRVYFSKQLIEGRLADDARAPLTTKRPTRLSTIRKEDRR